MSEFAAETGERLYAKSLLALPLESLVAAANKVRQDFLGDSLELCSIINAKSGRCSQDCKFCAQSGHHHTSVEVYPFKSSGQIVEAAGRAKDIGAERFGIVSSGNALTESEIETLEKAIGRIIKEVGVEVCGSLGALTKEQLEKLKNAGMLRYHHNIETSERYYPQIVSTHKFVERIDTIKAAKGVGLDVCSGGIIGMGENWDDRIDMAFALKRLGVDSVPINILIPIAGTAMEAVEPIEIADVIRTVAMFRIILEKPTIKIAAGREAVLKDEQIKGFLAGANGMLIGGYLTVGGADRQADDELIEEIKKAWKK